MARTAPPTLRQRRLAAELRKLRERAGFGTTEAAARLGIQPARMSMIEAGRYAVSSDRVRAMAQSYACADGRLVDALADMTGGRVRGWWDDYAELLPAAQVEVAECENWATSVTVGVVASLPGLVQTLEYARAVFRQSVPPMRSHDIEHRVSFRLKRQGALFREPRLPYTAIVHEAALRIRFGGSGTMRAQLTHMVEMAEQENVTVRVIPFDQDDFPAAGQPITFATGPLPQLDTVVLDSDHGCDFLDAEAQLAMYRSVLERMERCALSPADSRDFIRKIAKTV